MSLSHCIVGKILGKNHNEKDYDVSATRISDAHQRKVRDTVIKEMKQ